MTVAEVLDEIRLLTNYDSYPALSADQVTYLLGQARRADSDDNAPDTYVEWEAGAAYSLGDQVTPVERNGNLYEVITAGTADTAEPDWPTGSGDTVSDGSVVWQQVGAATWTPTYNISAAVAKGWQLKAGNVAGSYPFTAGKKRFDRDKVIANCLSMAKMYRSMGGGAQTVVTPSANADPNTVPILPTEDRWPDDPEYRW